MQDDMHQPKNENIKILTIGFVLILFIAIITILKPYVGGKNDEELPKESTADLVKRESVDTTKINKITPKELSGRIKSRDKIILIDLRDAVDFEMEHIPNSQNIPINQLSSAIKSLDKNKEYVLFDDICEIININSIADSLSVEGYKNIYYLEGGFNNWKNSFNQTITEGNPDSFSDQAKVNYLSSDQLKEMLASKEEGYFLLIDVRKNSEFNAGHLKGAINIPLDELERRNTEIPFRKEVILYDATGIDAFKAGVRLFDLGNFNAFTLSDGLLTWKQKGYEIVK